MPTHLTAPTPTTTHPPPPHMASSSSLWPCQAVPTSHALPLAGPCWLATRGPTWQWAGVTQKRACVTSESNPGVPLTQGYTQDPWDQCVTGVQYFPHTEMWTPFQGPTTAPQAACSCCSVGPNLVLLLPESDSCTQKTWGWSFGGLQSDHRCSLWPPLCTPCWQGMEQAGSAGHGGQSDVAAGVKPPLHHHHSIPRPQEDGGGGWRPHDHGHGWLLWPLLCLATRHPAPPPPAG